MSSNDFLPKFCLKFYCEKCDYSTCKKSSYDYHILSTKHKKSMVVNEILPKKSSYICEKCNKQYKDNSGLWRHKKKCSNNDSIITDNDNVTIISDMFVKLMLQNQELIKAINELAPKVGNTTNISNTTNNNQFNLQLFLNENCKNAMNIDDFAKSVAINMEDLYYTEKNGMTQGLISLMINKLKTMDITERPMHCTDLKREVIYVKKDKWIKDENNDIMKNTIYMVSAWQLYKLKEWINLHPDVHHSQESLDEFSKLANVLYKQVEGNDCINKKVLRSIADFIYIDKNTISNL